MTFDNLYFLLDETGIPLKRVKSTIEISPPYLVVCKGEQKLYGSDDRIRLVEYNPIIELYTTEEDYTSEDILTEFLISHNIRFSYTDDIQIENEDLYVKYFYLEKIIYKI